MKKIITAIAVAGALIVNAQAAVLINWSVGDPGNIGFWLNDANGGWPGTGAGAVGNNWVCQLIDGGASLPNYNALLTSYQGAAPTLASGTVLQSSAFDGNAGTPGFSASYSAGDNALASHYVYIRFFNNDQTQAGFIYNNSWQVAPDVELVVSGQGVGSQGTISTAPGPADSSLGLASSDTSAAPNPGFTSVQPVPEPTSLALFGLGGLLIGLRRKLRKA